MAKRAVRGQKTTPGPRVRDLTGHVFGKMAVESFAGVSSDGRHNAKWHCKCECGRTTVVFGYSLVSGNTTSCGCTRRHHGHIDRGKRTPTYTAWHNNKRDGCVPEWDVFAGFLADMGEKPPGMFLVRKDRTKPHGPANSAWSKTVSKQSWAPVEPVFAQFLCERLGESPQVEYQFTAVRKWRLDVCFPTKKVGIELDGAAHLRWKQRVRDMEKSNFLNEAGWRLLRYPARDVFNPAKREEMIGQILAVLQLPVSRTPKTFDPERAANVLSSPGKR